MNALDSREQPEATNRIAKLKKPLKDSLYGATGGLTLTWKAGMRIAA
jgi:hypothetical protein